jgi:very-short-patch-repair endonuclease
MTPDSEKLKKELEKLNIRVLAGVKERDEDGDVVKPIDLAIPAARLNIEVDGRHHLTSSRQIRADLERATYSSSTWPDDCGLAQIGS